ncbi:LuxR C-terminal-related transcriptional regulator [Pseudenhygromyxa sp. WMMC2535]|uniref:LuxR C-terminal-related transcriptional regulator n=1 Tax=Pseudenhygromyxa sp. WMMC2535 TaxID=2712867 RepID=UPI001C3E41C7|nr:LuxR C-terminal-related transcriptional regulator [Pseudenhygromyxa sp. WMMC2535]
MHGGTAGHQVPESCSDGLAEVAIIDMARNCGWSIGLISALRSSRSPCAAIVLVESEHSEEVTRSLHLGAVDCLRKPVAHEDLIEAVEFGIACTQRWRHRISSSAAVFDGQGWLSAKAASREPPSETRLEQLSACLAEEHELTPRESEVLYWLLAGHRYDDIGVALGVSPRTAKYHGAKLLRKLDLDSRHELPRLLAEVGR